MLNEALEKVSRKEDLTRAEMAELLDRVIAGEASASQVAGLLIGLRVKGESVEELVGAAEALRRHAVQLPGGERPMLDTAGTGGDGSGSLNLSTAAAIVAAAAGVSVAKHGNRSISSRCGSFDLLNELGVPTDLEPDEASAAIARDGFAFLFAPQYHPATRAVAAIRRDLGVRTLFNLLGPLTNPTGVRTQVAGVYHPSRADLLAAAIAASGTERAIVVSAEIGLDEVAPCGATQIVEVIDGRTRRYEVTPGDFGLAEAPFESIKGGEPADNARILRDVLEGGSHAARTGVLVNAAAALYAAGTVANYREGAALAIETIDSGRAADKLAALARRLAPAVLSAAEAVERVR